MAFDNRRTPTWKMHVASLSCGVALLTILCIGPILNHSLEWYNNYGYSSGVAGGSQDLAAYSTRQSAALHSNVPCKGTSTSSPADDADPRSAAADRDIASYRRPTPGSASWCLDQSSGDVVPPAPTSTFTPTNRLISTAARLTTPLDGDALLYSVPMDRVAVHVDDDDDDDEVRQQHARSHSAPAAPRPRRHGNQHGAPSPATGPSLPPASWYLKKRTDVERRLLPSPPPPPSAAPQSAASPAVPRGSTLTGNNLRCRRTFPPASDDVELNGPTSVVHADATTRRPNSVTAAVTGGCEGCETPPAVLTRRRLRAARGRLNLYTAGSGGSADCAGGLASMLAGMAIVAVVALVLSVVSVQLLLHLTARRSTSHDDAAQTTNVVDSLLPAATSQTDDISSGGTMITRTVVEEVTVALAAVTVALDVCCLLTICMQCFLAVKLAHCRDAELRVVGYLEKCSVTRTAASAGLFLSLPIFLLALMLYAVLEYTFTSAITCVIIFSVGIICSALTISHSVHFWNVEKHCARASASESSYVKTSSPAASSVLQSTRDASKQTTNSLSDTDNSAAITQLKLSTLV